jgi:small subunit ribosomal protein S11
MSDTLDSKVDIPPSASEEAAKGKSGMDSLFGDDVGEVKVRKAKKSKNVSKGKCTILATFNNTHVSFTDMGGNVISWSNAGKCNFRGSRKSTAYAAQVVVQDAGRTAMSHGIKEVTIVVKGPGMGRDSAIRTVQSLGLSIDEIVDVTAVPHNGCRPRKPRRV